MANLPTISGVNIEERRRLRDRVGRRDIMPTSVRGSMLPQDLIRNSGITQGTFNFADGVVTTLTVRTYSSVNPNIRLGTLPFMAALFNTGALSSIAPGTNQIPFDTTTGDFDVYGPFAMPNYTVNSKRYISTSGVRFATDGNDVVFKTAIRNSSGGAQDVYYIVQTRVIQSRGGGLS